MFNRMRLILALKRAAHNGPIVAETFMALTAVRWAVYLVIPANILANNTAATQRIMKLYAPAWAWALAFAVLGLGQFLAAVRNWSRVRTGVALAAAGWWTMITVFVGLTHFDAATINLATFIIAEAMIYAMLIIAFDEEDEP